MSFLNTVLSLSAAGLMAVSAAVGTAAPQHDPAGFLFLVNRSWLVSEAYVPAGLREAEVPGSVRRLRPEAAAALERMFAACKEEAGVTLISVSGYRSYGSQRNIYARKLRSVGGNAAKAQEYVAPPGTSEHNTGLVMDVGQKNKAHLNEKFRDTVGGAWCRENCWRFGFILRYDEGWEEITGYSFEPWHFRYVGLEEARRIHEAGLPLESWLPARRTEIMLSLLTEDPNQ